MHNTKWFNKSVGRYSCNKATHEQCRGVETAYCIRDIYIVLKIHKQNSFKITTLVLHSSDGPIVKIFKIYENKTYYQ